MLVLESYVTNKEASLSEKYMSLRKKYENGETHIISCERAVFEPFPKPSVPWDISELEKKVVYDPEIRKLRIWIYKKIILQLDLLNHDTIGVLIRIATGMLNKIDIPKGDKLILHEHMVKNIQDEYFKIITESLPFVESAEPDENRPF